MLRMKRALVQITNSTSTSTNAEDAVCVDFDGTIKDNMSFWKHEHMDKCSLCLCKVTKILFGICMLE